MREFEPVSKHPDSTSRIRICPAGERNEFITVTNSQDAIDIVKESEQPLKNVYLPMYEVL